ncbi:MAG: hypothetical protein DYG83_08510 [Candidatus Brocadia sp. AMX2]|nr:MAG: hypothetical protein EDM70_08705 [Candidatus Brocadia sp. AMX2]MBC6932642.1 hypothetical protein [Candidatus Brocadia sp.]MBL1169535.1 hypothetical protein [Candidatus Brocadia sp. AMX1]MCE7866854.1 hypothetical protein [Candidatus Brocadia sp. AMX2]MCQ3918582.1 hypothetical protein [Candidatus Brocadia sp.]
MQKIQSIINKKNAILKIKLKNKKGQQYNAGLLCTETFLTLMPWMKGALGSLLCAKILLTIS